MLNINSVISEVARYGLIARGGFRPTTADAVPAIKQNDNLISPQYLLLVGNAGSQMWTAFCNSPEYKDAKPHPLNRWSVRIGNEVAQHFAATVLFAFDKTPPHPFMKWAKRAEGLQNSKLGIAIHPRYGLWHAYRFALAFAEIPNGADELIMHSGAENICQNCAEQPCLHSCPVGAFSDAGFASATCAQYLHAQPKSQCMQGGCLARVACPYKEYNYSPAHTKFHMRAFATAMANKEFGE